MSTLCTLLTGDIDQHAAVSVKLFESAADDTKQTNNAMTLAINVTFSGIDRSTGHLQPERNKHRWSSSDWISISQSITTNSAASDLQYFEVNASSEAGTIEIDSQTYPIESSIYWYVYYNSNASARDHIESVKFSLLFIELRSNNQNESISEVWISNYEASYYSITQNVAVTLIIIYYFMSFFNEAENKFKGVYLSKYNKVIITSIFSLFVYLLALLFLKLIDEIHPLSVNIFVFVISNMLFLIWSIIIKLN